MLPATVRADQWPQFRGPNGTAVSPATGLPTQWSNTENLRWQAALPGRGVSCPVVADGRVYVTACSGALQQRLHVLCFATATGKQLWERQFWATGSTMCNAKTCMAAPTPVTDGTHVYALFATGDLAALDAKGNLLWYRALVQDYPNITNQVGMAASPILWKDILLLPLENAGDSQAIGLDRRTGQNRWRIPRTREINWVTPVLRSIGGRTEVLFQSSRELLACDPETGKIIWTYRGEGPGASPSPVVAKDIVMAGGTAIRPESGANSPQVVWSTPKLRTAYSSALYHEDRFYAVNGAGVLSCAAAADGKVLWQERLKGPLWASPVYAEGRLYLVNEAGTTTVIELGNEPKVLAYNPLGETMLATPAIAGGAIFLRSDQHLYCVARIKPE